jgi:hypothetical protein
MIRPLAALAVAVAALAPVAAPAPVLAQAAIGDRVLRPEVMRPVCKTQNYTVQSSLSAQDARDRWSGHVRSMFGTNWSLWTAAASRNEAVIQQLSGNIYVATGRPCRSLSQLIQP